MGVRAWPDKPQAVSGSLSFVLFFTRFRQGRGRVDVKVAVVGMFFPERVFEIHGEFFSPLQNVRELCVDKLELLTGEFRTEPDNKTRDLIHGFDPPDD